MNPEIKTKWTTRLRSKQDVQGREYLRSADNKLCCLGVLCEIAVEEGVIPAPHIKSPEYLGRAMYWYGSGTDTHIVLPRAVQEWAGLLDSDPMALPELGDENGTLGMINDGGATFDEIADIIDEKL